MTTQTPPKDTGGANSQDRWAKIVVMDGRMQEFEAHAQAVIEYQGCHHCYMGQ